MGKLSAKSDYESLRNARILENQVRLSSLGVHKAISELRSITKPVKTQVVKTCQNKKYQITPLRRSTRLKSIPSTASTPTTINLRRSNRLRGKGKGKVSDYADAESDEEGEEKSPANAPLVKISGARHQLLPEDSARRCLGGEGRGKVYNPVFGICCHFCRQKTLCAEEDCKRCGNLDVNQPCIGKTDCSACHSSNGVLCRACLKVRYGEGKANIFNSKRMD
ncbi:hypothetical protein PTKIN_Ptkin04bG0098300 [Pterospermum kingtungense]